MNGLIKKDFYLTMKEIPVLFFVIVGAGGALANLTSPLIFIIAAAVIFSTATLTTIQNDKATSWNKFSITLPVSKQQIVIEKYVVYALLVVFGILVGSIISIPIAIGTKTFQMDSYLATVFIGLALALISGSFSIPCSFVFPIEKNVLIVSLSALGTIGFSFLIMALVDLFFSIENYLLIGSCIIAVLGIFSYIASASIAKKTIYRRGVKI